MIISISLEEVSSLNSQHEIQPQPEPCRPERSAGSLLVLMHAFNVDGASLMVLTALKDRRFRKRFSRITLVSPSNGELQDVIRDIPGLTAETMPWHDERMLRHLLDHDHVWINSFDHPAELLELLGRLEVGGLLFGHESLHLDSLIRATVDLGPRKLDAVRQLMRQGRISVGLPSRSTQRYAEQFLAPGVEHIPYGIDLDFKPPSLMPYETLDPVRFVVPGWLCDRKNQKCVPWVLKSVVDKMTREPGRNWRDWRLTFAGTAFGNGEYRQFMRETLAELPASQLSFQPMMSNEDMRALLCNHHFVLFPSYNEALPVTVMEAMSGGRVVIGSDCEGCDELIEHGVNGYQYRRGDFAAFCDIIENVLDADRTSPEDLRRMSEQAQRTVQAYSLDNYTERLLSMFRSAQTTYRHLEFPNDVAGQTDSEACNRFGMSQGAYALTVREPRPAQGSRSAGLAIADVSIRPQSTFSTFVHIPQNETGSSVEFCLELQREGASQKLFQTVASKQQGTFCLEQDLGNVCGRFDLSLSAEAVEDDYPSRVYIANPELRSRSLAIRQLVPAGLPPISHPRAATRFNDDLLITEPRCRRRFRWRRGGQAKFDISNLPSTAKFESVIYVSAHDAPPVTFLVELLNGFRVVSHHRCVVCGATGCQKIEFPIDQPATHLRLRTKWTNRATRPGRPGPAWYRPRLICFGD